MPPCLPIATFSIVACDPGTGDLGVGVQSKFFAVGTVVPWARAGVGAVATQAWANPRYGPDGLERLAAGAAPDEVVAALVDADDYRNVRQIGLVDARGRSAAYTGKHCLPWAGHATGPNFACQGNILASERVVAAMAEAFAAGSGPLAERLVAALRAAQAAGGDSRGQQSAALLVVRAGAGYGGESDRYIDLRVDDHPEPIEELARLLAVYRETVLAAMAQGALRLDGDLARMAQATLGRLGYYQGGLTGRFDAALEAGLRRFCEAEGFTGWQGGPEIPVELFHRIRDRYAQA